MQITKEQFKEDYQRVLRNIQIGKNDANKPLHQYNALAKLIGEYISDEWLEIKKLEERSDKKVYYFSIEFLLGRLLDNTLINLGIRKICREGLEELGIELKDLEEVEGDQALGNGGLGRLAACFLDSIASIGISGHGCGIRYKYGFFKQKIIDNNQVEIANDWTEEGSLWETKRVDRSEKVRFWGNVETIDENGELKFIQKDYSEVLAIPFDTPVVGYKNEQINTLRLWSAEPVKSGFDYQEFSHGHFVKAMEYKDQVEAISNVLYPDDSEYNGKLLRLKQEYFLVSAGLQSIIRTFKEEGGDVRNFDKHTAIQLNDTHPILAIPELMRILMDEEGLGWDDAWRITVNTFAYTNHTILAEALEKWDVNLFKPLLPRIYMIVHEINERYCKDLWKLYEGDWDKIAEMAIISNGYIKMANLGVVGSHSVNGVAELHTKILKTTVMNDLYNVFPDKFNNKTNGITHRRWLLSSNRELTKLIESKIGKDFEADTEKLRDLMKYEGDKKFIEKLNEVKLINKRRLVKYIKENNGIDIDENSIFDTQVKRIHAYKRQTLNIFRIMDLYNKLLENPDLDIVPRTFIFAGKAASSYSLAKRIIELINVVGNRINKDTRIKGKIKVVYLEDYKVSLAEIIIPATDVSEQISTATKEASGTSNMKFMMNGAVTVATMDGANIEIAERVGSENIITFGLSNEEVLSYYQKGGYCALDEINRNLDLKKVMSQLIDGTYRGVNGSFMEIYNSIVKYNDEFFNAKDFPSYLEAQDKIDRLYRDRNKWGRICLNNIAKSGFFSSDRTIVEYANDIWGVPCSLLDVRK
ncbi:MAG: glycogen/starch/alpha-glucan phosphorylase [Sarcina sp.]